MDGSDVNLPIRPLTATDRPATSSNLGPTPQAVQNEDALPIFYPDKVQIAFSVAADFAAAAIANNVLILGLHSGRIMRIDWDAASEVDGTSIVWSYTTSAPRMLTEVIPLV